MLQHDIIKKKCEARRMTAYALGKKAQISPTYAYKLYEGVATNPSAKVLDKVAFALDCSPRDLLY